MYALMGMLAIAAAMVLAKWLKTPDNRRYLALYALLMTLSFYTHYFTIFTLIAHWLVVLALSCRREGVRYIKQPAWWLANVAIGVAYIPAAGAVQSAGAYRRTAGRRRRRLDPSGLRGDLPAMYWRFLTSHDGSNYPTAILWLLPAMFIALCALLLKRRAMPRTFSLLLLGGILIPVTLVFAISGARRCLSIATSIPPRSAFRWCWAC